MNPTQSSKFVFIYRIYTEFNQSKNELHIEIHSTTIFLSNCITCTFLNPWESRQLSFVTDRSLIKRKRLDVLYILTIAKKAILCLSVCLAIVKEISLEQRGLNWLHIFTFSSTWNKKSFLNWRVVFSSTHMSVLKAFICIIHMQTHST